MFVVWCLPVLVQSHSNLQALNQRVNDKPSQHVAFGCPTAKRMTAVPVGVVGMVIVVLRDVAMHRQKRFAWQPHLNLCLSHDVKAKCYVCLQNALKIFRKMPSALMDIVKGTDPTTVTQHGLYMRPLTDPSLHPLLAPNRGPLDKPPEQPVAPGTPPHEETAGSTSAAASGQTSSGQVNSSDSGSTTAVCQPQQVVTQEAAREAEGPSPALTAGTALTKAADALSLNPSAPEDKAMKPDENNPDSNSRENSPAVPAPTPPTLEGSSQMSKDISSSPMGAALGALSGSKAEGEPAASEGKFPASGGHPVGTGLNPQGGNLCTQPVGANSDPSQLWGRGRVTLLGDAAHATIPNGI